MEGDGQGEGVRGSAGELVTRLTAEDGRADGNLIAAEGIFLGKGELCSRTPVVYDGDVDCGIAHECGSLSYKSGEADSAFEA
jgi:hypothetical protein